MMSSSRTLLSYSSSCAQDFVFWSLLLAIKIRLFVLSLRIFSPLHHLFFRKFLCLFNILSSRILPSFVRIHFFKISHFVVSDISKNITLELSPPISLSDGLGFIVKHRNNDLTNCNWLIRPVHPHPRLALPWAIIPLRKLENKRSWFCFQSHLFTNRELFVGKYVICELIIFIRRRVPV